MKVKDISKYPKVNSPYGQKLMRKVLKGELSKADLPKFSRQTGMALKFPPYEGTDEMFFKKFLEHKTVVKDHQGIEVYDGIRFDSLAKAAITERELELIEKEKNDLHQKHAEQDMMKSKAQSLNSEVSGDPKDPYVILKKYFRKKVKEELNSPKIQSKQKQLKLKDKHDQYSLAGMSSLHQEISVSKPIPDRASISPRKLPPEIQNMIDVVKKAFTDKAEAALSRKLLRKLDRYQRELRQQVSGFIDMKTTLS